MPFAAQMCKKRNHRNFNGRLFSNMVSFQRDVTGYLSSRRYALVEPCVFCQMCEFIGGSMHVGLKVVGRGLNECHFVNRVLDFNLLPETINLLETRGI